MRRIPTFLVPERYCTDSRPRIIAMDNAFILPSSVCKDGTQFSVIWIAMATKARQEQTRDLLSLVVALPKDRELSVAGTGR